MSDHILKTIEQAKEELRKHELAAVDLKKMINQLCAFAGLPLAYENTELQETRSGPLVILRNAFFGKPLATCVRDFLEMRKNKPVKEAALNDIIDALNQGGYDLKRHGETEDDQKRGVAITLAKNPQFHKLPNGDWGLLAWYPGVKKAKAEGKTNGEKDANAEKAEELKEAGLPISETDEQTQGEQNQEEAKPTTE